MALPSTAWPKGKSGNPLGRKTEKPFADALKLELAAAGGDQKALRNIARSLIALAGGDGKTTGDLAAITALADRLDGKPAQDSTVTIEKRDATDWSLSELVSLFHERRAARGRDPEKSRSTTELN
jgi:hypothetical protein